MRTPPSSPLIPAKAGTRIAETAILARAAAAEAGARRVEIISAPPLQPDWTGALADAGRAAPISDGASPGYRFRRSGEFVFVRCETPSNGFEFL